MSIIFEPLKADEAVKYIRAKGLQLSYNYTDLMYQAHENSFTVAKMMKLDLLKDMHEAIAKNIEDGTPFATFKKNIKPTLQKKGWWGTKDIVNPKTGEIKEVHIGSRRLKNILHTNKKMAQSKGRYNQVKNFKHRVYLRYVAKQYGNRREKHKAAHGLVKHRDDPWWDSNYPINGYGCECNVFPFTKKGLEAEGYKISDSKVPNVADKGWDFHSGKTNNINKIYKQKVDDLQKPCKENNARKKRCYKNFAAIAKKEYGQWEKTLKERLVVYKGVKSLFQKKPKKKVIELCKSNIFGKEKSVLLSADTVQSHLHHKNIGAFDYYLIPQMLKDKKRVFMQKENTFVIVKKLGSFYRVALKNIIGKDEIYAVSLVNISLNITRELKKLSKFKEVKE